MKNKLKIRLNKAGGVVALLSMFLISGLSTSAQEKDYMEYHRQTVLIEGRLLGESDDTTILSLYKNLFDEFEPFAREVIVALQLACRQKDQSVMRYFFRKAFLNGISKWHCDFFPFIKNQWGNRHDFNLTELYDSCRKAYLSKINLSLRTQIYRRKRFDDSIKHLPKGYPTTAEGKMALMDKNNVLRKKMYGQFVGVTEENILYVIDVSKQLGFVPFERTLGIGDISIDGFAVERKFSLDDVELIPQGMAQLFWHHGYGFFNLKKELVKSMLMGELHPRIYAFIYDFAVNYYRDTWYYSAAGNYGQYTKLKLNDSLEQYTNQYRIVQIETWEKLRDENFIDACRKQIGVCSRSQDRQAKEYQKRTGIILRFGFFEY